MGLHGPFYMVSNRTPLFTSMVTNHSSHGFKPIDAVPFRTTFPYYSLRQPSSFLFLMIYLAVLIVEVYRKYAVFVIQNHETVKVWFLFWQITGAWAVGLILTFAMGCVTGWLVGIQQKKTRR